MKLTYDPTVDAATIYLRQGVTSARTEEVAPGVLVDFDDEDRPIALELLDASAVFGGPPQGVEFVLLTAKAAAHAG